MLLLVVLPNVSRFATLFLLQGNLSLVALAFVVGSFRREGLTAVNVCIALCCTMGLIAAALIATTLSAESVAVIACGTVAPLLLSAPLLHNFFVSSRPLHRNMAAHWRMCSTFCLQRGVWIVVCYTTIGFMRDPYALLIGFAAPANISGTVGASFGVAVGCSAASFALSRLASRLGMLVPCVVLPAVLATPLAWLVLPSVTCGFSSACINTELGLSAQAMAMSAVSFVCTSLIAAFAWRKQFTDIEGSADTWVWETYCGVVPVNYLLANRVRHPVVCLQHHRSLIQRTVASPSPPLPAAIFFVHSFGPHDTLEKAVQFFALLGRIARTPPSVPTQAYIAFEGGANGLELCGPAKQVIAWLWAHTSTEKQQPEPLVATPCGLMLRKVLFPPGVGLCIHVTDTNKTRCNRGEGLVLCLDSVMRSADPEWLQCNGGRRAIVVLTDGSPVSLSFSDVLAAAEEQWRQRRNCCAVVGADAIVLTGRTGTLPEIYEAGRCAAISQCNLSAETACGTLLTLSRHFSVVCLSALSERLQTISPAQLLLHRISAISTSPQDDPVEQLLAERILRKSLAIARVPLLVPSPLPSTAFQDWAEDRAREVLGRLHLVGSILPLIRYFLQQSPFVTVPALCCWTFSLLPTLLAPVGLALLISSAVLCVVAPRTWVAFGCGIAFSAIHSTICVCAQRASHPRNKDTSLPQLFWVAVVFWMLVGNLLLVSLTVAGAALSGSPLVSLLLAPHVVFLFLELVAALPAAIFQSPWSLLRPLFGPFLETAVLAFALFPASHCRRSEPPAEQPASNPAISTDTDESIISPEVVAGLCKRASEGQQSALKQEQNYRCSPKVLAQLDRQMAAWAGLGNASVLVVCALLVMVIPSGSLWGLAVFGAAGAVPALPALCCFAIRIFRGA